MLGIQGQLAAAVGVKTVFSVSFVSHFMQLRAFRLQPSAGYVAMHRVHRML